MIKRVALVASLLVVMSASFAAADVTYTAEITVSDGAALDDLTPGSTVTIDVTLRSDGTATFGVGASAFGYDSSVVEFTSGSTVPNALVATCIPGTGCFGGLDSSQVVQQISGGEDSEVQFFNGLSLSGTTATGENDPGTPGFPTGVAGEPQFSLVFTVGDEGSTTMGVGTSMDYGDAVVGDGGSFLAAANESITLTVPEPGAVVSSLAALGSVFAVVGLRRRD